MVDSVLMTLWRRYVDVSCAAGHHTARKVVWKARLEKVTLAASLWVTPPPPPGCRQT
jgi:hypothetical protein